MITRIDYQSPRRSEATGLPLRTATIRLNDSGEGLPWDVEIDGVFNTLAPLRGKRPRLYGATTLRIAQSIAARWVNDGELP